MTNIYCASCNTEVIESVKVCPQCGNKTFNPISSNQTTNLQFPTTDVSQQTNSASTVTNAPHTQQPIATKKSWSWDWLWQAIAITLIMKFFGPAGGLTAALVYFWQKPKRGKWPAMGIAAFAGILVPLLILAAFRS
jgi:hypothetical protein